MVAIEVKYTGNKRGQKRTTTKTKTQGHTKTHKDTHTLTHTQNNFEHAHFQVADLASLLCFLTYGSI